MDVCVLCLVLLVGISLADYCPDPPTGDTCFSNRGQMASRVISTIKPGASWIDVSDFQAAWDVYSDPEHRLLYGESGYDLIHMCTVRGSQRMTASSIESRCACFGQVAYINELCELLHNIDTDNMMS
jgi:hypothetical protein